MATIKELAGKRVSHPASSLIYLRVSEDGQSVLKKVCYGIITSQRRDAWVPVRVDNGEGGPYRSYDFTPAEMNDNAWIKDKYAAENE